MLLFDCLVVIFTPISYNHAMDQSVNGITPSNWIQIGIALIALGGIIAAFFAAFLSWRSRALLLATKEKHSRDLMGILDIWTQDVANILPDDTPPLDETLPSDKTIFSIETNILFSDLENHIPAELGIFKTWDSFKSSWQNLQTRRITYYQSIRNHLERFSGLKSLTFAEENGQNLGITHSCLQWMYTNILGKAKGKSISLPELFIPDAYPNELMTSGQVWSWTNTPPLFKSLLITVIENIENEQSNVAEYDLLVKAREMLESQRELEQLKENLLSKIAEAKAIPILTGDCKHLKRAMEPLFPLRRGRQESNVVDKRRYSVSVVRRFNETASIAVVFLTFSVVVISTVDFNNIVTFKGIPLLVLAIVTFVLFIVFSIGLIWSRATEWYGSVFESTRSWKSKIFIGIFWPVIVIGFLVALFSKPLPEYLIFPATILAIVWGIYVIIAILRMRHLSI